MMVVDTALVTTKGQVTFPARVRKALNLQEGDRLLVEVTGESVAEVRVLRRRGLSDFRGVFKTDKTFPGMEEVRRVVARSRAARYAPREDEGGDEGPGNPR
jgi:AbrB family looped-hinge helix DNA binding protein